jgi:Leucine-rich repeat (LRR) protein
MSIFTIDIDSFLNRIGRDTISELTILYDRNQFIITAIHYHNIPYLSKYLIQSGYKIQSDKKTSLHSTMISSLYGLFNLVRLKITNIPHLIELPSFADSIHLKKLLCYENGLQYLPSYLPQTIDYIDCGRNNLKELPNKMPSQLKMLYCNHNQLHYLPLLSIDVRISCISNNPFFSYIGNQYHRSFIKRNSIILRFRWNYYVLKFGRRFFFSMLRRRMSRYKNELLEMSARITMNPTRVMRLLEIYDNLEDILI